MTTMTEMKKDTQEWSEARWKTLCIVFLLGIGMLLALYMVSQINTVRFHESAHQQVFAEFGCSSTITIDTNFNLTQYDVGGLAVPFFDEGFGGSGGRTTPDRKDQGCLWDRDVARLQSLTEIVGYHTMAALTQMWLFFFATYVLVFGYLIIKHEPREDA